MIYLTLASLQYIWTTTCHILIDVTICSYFSLNSLINCSDKNYVEISVIFTEYLRRITKPLYPPHVVGGSKLGKWCRFLSTGIITKKSAGPIGYWNLCYATSFPLNSTGCMEGQLVKLVEEVVMWQWWVRKWRIRPGTPINPNGS